MKKFGRKLSLDKETVRSLMENELANIAGGDRVNTEYPCIQLPTYPCPSQYPGCTVSLPHICVLTCGCPTTHLGC